MASVACPALAETVPTFPGPPIATPELVVSLPDAGGYGVASDGGDGVWFNDIEPEQGKAVPYLAHYTPELGALQRVPLKSSTPGPGWVWGITPGLHGEELFVSFEEGLLSQITANGKLKNKMLPAADGNPQSLVVSADGTVWFLSRAHGCYLVHVTQKGKLLSSTALGDDCYTLTIGPDGNIWVAVYTSSYVDEVSAASGSVIAQYAIRLPVGIATLGNDIYVSQTEPGVIAKIDPAGEVTEYVLPTPRKLEWMTAGPDGAVWFDELQGPNNTPGLGRLSPTGELSEVEVGASFIAATSDAIYFRGYVGSQGGLVREPLGNFVPPEPTYVALGDSYSSGEGNPPYAPGTDEQADKCHRSDAAYGPLLDQALNLGATKFSACSGAITDDFFNANHLYPTEPRQLDSLSAATKTVTLTIGGDDAGFPEVVNDCVNVGIQAGFGCSTGQALRDGVSRRLTALSGGAPESIDGHPIHSYLSVLEAIHKEAPNARIVIGGYPLLFGTDEAGYRVEPKAPSGRTCTVGTSLAGPLEVDYSDAQWMNAEGLKLDSIIKKAVKQAKKAKIPVGYASPTGFLSHGLCDSSQSWLNPVTVNGTEPDPGSLHPNSVGQQGYEAAFSAALE